MKRVNRACAWSRWIAVLGLVFTLLPLSAEAKNLHGRLGLGYNNQFSNSSASERVPGVSVKYGMTTDISLVGIFGMKTASPKNSVTAVKMIKGIHFETSLNFYFVIGGGLVSASNNSGAEFLGGFGVEFFIPGLESLGISFETGISMNNLAGSFSVNTMGANILDAGVHFYF